MGGSGDGCTLLALRRWFWPRSSASIAVGRRSGLFTQAEQSGTFSLTIRRPSRSQSLQSTRNACLAVAVSHAPQVRSLAVIGRNLALQTLQVRLWNLPDQTSTRRVRQLEQ